MWLANIRTPFKYLNKEAFKSIHSANVRPLLVYAAPTWHLHLVKREKLKKDQRFATKLVLELRSLSYEDRFCPHS